MSYSSQSTEELITLRDNTLQTVININAELESRLIQTANTINDLNGKLDVLETQNNENQQLRGLVQQLFSHVQSNNNDKPKPKARGKVNSKSVSNSVSNSEAVEAVPNPKPSGRGRAKK